MAHLTVRFRVTGHVQGVGFRAYVQSQARDMGASGWVANASDGSVVGVMSLPESLLPRLREILRAGPPRARVEDLEIGEAAPPFPGVGEPFRIERDSL